MLGFEQSRYGIGQPYGTQVGRLRPSAAAQQETRHVFATIDLAMAECAAPPRVRTRGRPKANRAAIARSLAAMPILGIITVNALIAYLAEDAEFRLQCGWQEPSEVPTPATFSRARAELADILPQAVQRLLPFPGRQSLPFRAAPEKSPEPPVGADADPLLLLLNRHLLSMIRGEERDLTLSQLAIFLTCYVGDRQHRVQSSGGRTRPAAGRRGAGAHVPSATQAGEPQGRSGEPPQNGPAAHRCGTRFPGAAAVAAGKRARRITRRGGGASPPLRAGRVAAERAARPADPAAMLRSRPVLRDPGGIGTVEPVLSRRGGYGVAAAGRQEQPNRTQAGQCCPAPATGPGDLSRRPR